MDGILQDLIKFCLTKWFSPSTADWEEAFRGRSAFRNYKWGVMWVNSKHPSLCGFWAWKAWLMNLALLILGLVVFVNLFGKL